MSAHFHQDPVPTISLCMIVKNEEAVIERCLNSIVHLVDEIIIVDTGSVDRTIDICRKFTNKMYHFEWCNDFAKARNYSFKHASSDYILWLDADDVIEPEQAKAFIELKQDLTEDVYFLKYNYAQDANGQSTCLFYRERLVRNDSRFTWIYPIHEVIDNVYSGTTCYTEIAIRHLRSPTEKNGEKRRNLSILEQAIQQPEYQSSPRIWYYYGRELFDHHLFLKANEAFEVFLGFDASWIEDQIGAFIRLAQSYYELQKTAGSASEKELFQFKSREMARKAIALDDRWAEPYFVLGQIAMTLRAYDEAIFWFGKCLRPVPDVISPVRTTAYGFEAHVQLMFCHDHLQNYQQANYHNEEALKYNPYDSGLLQNRSYFHNRIS